MLKLLAPIISLVLASLAFAAPTTQPGHSTQYMDGWTTRVNATPATIAGWQDADRIMTAPPVAPPPTVPPKPPATQPTTKPAPLPTGDIAALLNKATAPVNLPKGNYTCSSAVVLNVSVQANGSTITCPSGMTNFRSAKPGLTFDNFTAPTGGVLFEFGADKCTVSNFTIGTPTQAFKTIPGGSNPSVINGTIGLTVTCSMYFDEGGVTIADVNAAGVTKGAEYTLRFDVPATNAIQSGAVVKNCNLINHSNVKDTVGIRAFRNVSITGGSIVGDVRLGQDPPAGNPQTSAVGQYCDGITIQGVAFTANELPTCAVQGYEGVRASVKGCTFAGYTVPCITAGAFSEITTAGNAGPSAVKLWAGSSRGRQIVANN